MSRVKFIDVYTGPESIGEYQWQINHSEEEPTGATLNVDHTAPTSGVGFVRQIGDPEPYTRHVKGTILDRPQFQKFWTYFAICVGLGPGPQRTIHWVDQLNARFEILFTSFVPQYHRAARNPHGTTDDEKLSYWTYDATFEVLNVISNWP